MLPAPVSHLVEDLLARLDRALPGRVEGLYVVGSASTGAFRHGRSDLDFVAIVDGDLSPRELARLCAVHLGRWASALVHDSALRRRWPLVCNGIYVRPEDLTKSPLTVTPVAGHVSGRFRISGREGFDVNPATWHTLARHGIPVRGPDRTHMQVRADPAELRSWTRANLNTYWRRWVERARRPGMREAMLSRRFTAAGALGVTRLHYTVATGEIASKEETGAYALATFDPRWRPLIEDALAWWRIEPSPPPYRGHPVRRRRDTAAFVAHVIDAGNALP
ncbi:MAG: DUF4111 domain-containing protein [Solirubrobacterales bacterium]|nr:DUF4111 domain-containing protein [Solirubrobacterales bacterium]